LIFHFAKRKEKEKEKEKEKKKEKEGIKELKQKSPMQ
jgi:hypothetical protein